MRRPLDALFYPVASHDTSLAWMLNECRGLQDRIGFVSAVFPAEPPHPGEK
jgi:hypothetical protein